MPPTNTRGNLRWPISLPSVMSLGCGIDWSTQRNLKFYTHSTGGQDAPGLLELWDCSTTCCTLKYYPVRRNYLTCWIFPVFPAWWQGTHLALVTNARSMKHKRAFLNLAAWLQWNQVEKQGTMSDLYLMQETWTELLTRLLSFQGAIRQF